MSAGEIKEESLKGKTIVVFDILRATSTIVTALANGCREVVPFVEVEEAQAFARGRRDVVLGGERDSLLIPGFHLSNSPLEYTPERVQGKTVVLSTTNGTRAIRGAAEGAGQVLIGSLLNARAVARAIVERGGNIVLVCAGTRGKYSLEDTVAAGMVVLEIAELAGEAGLSFESDLAVSAYRLAIYYRKAPLKILYDSLHGQKLAAMGLSEDLAWCARLNHFDIVPVYQEGNNNLDTIII